MFELLDNKNFHSKLHKSNQINLKNIEATTSVILKAQLFYTDLKATAYIPKSKEPRAKN